MKLGGSVITEKAADGKRPRLDAIARLAAEVASCGDRVVVVHGAGSYGHPKAREFRLRDGDDGSSTRRLAAAEVHADVRELTGLVLQALRGAGLPAMSLSAYDLARLTNGALTTFAYEPVHETLAGGFVPVLSGDVAMDSARGFGIVSGDALMVELARVVRPARAVFATNVDGIFDREPAEPGARLLPEVDLRQSVAFGGGHAPDVTGSMQGKLSRARDVARLSVAVHVVNGLAPGRVGDALAGKPTTGTIVRG